MAPTPDPLADLWRSLPRMGDWLDEASCAELGPYGAAVFTEDQPDEGEAALAEAVCWRCPVRLPCADYAAQVPSWGLWGADWHRGKARERGAA